MLPLARRLLKQNLMPVGPVIVVREVQFHPLPLPEVGVKVLPGK